MKGLGLGLELARVKGVWGTRMVCVCSKHVIFCVHVCICVRVCLRVCCDILCACVYMC